MTSKQTINLYFWNLPFWHIISGNKKKTKKGDKKTSIVFCRSNLFNFPHD